LQFTDNQLLSGKNPNNIFKNFGQGQGDGHGKFCFHLGVLIFAPFFNKLSQSGLHYIRQWLAAILLGCQNIEQSKELNYTSMHAMFGKVYKTLRTQRISLKDAATIENTEKIMQVNAELLGVNQQQDFYYDPHTKHYTGFLKTLSTWCPSVRLADKGLNMDYIHTTGGQPVYFNTSDNFYDLRERFTGNVEHFRSLYNFNEEAVLTYIIDRGIYSMDVFEKIIESPNSHIITWEKGYEAIQWDEDAPCQHGHIIKTRNHKKDTKLVHYRYQEKVWHKNERMRQIIVRVYDKNWKVLIEVSILTDDKKRDAQQVIELMLNRWVQENDFKYMIKHFGLNQITSYAFTDYKDLKTKIEDKVYICSEHKTLTKEIHKIRNKLKTALLSKHRFIEKYQEDAGKLPERLKQRKSRIYKKVDELNEQLLNLEEQRSATTKYVSRIDELIEQEYVRLDTNTKNYMDAIKVLARNIFYLTFAPFKENYNNYRDDHVIFRHITRSAGILESKNDNINIWLTPQMEYQKKTKEKFNDFLTEINRKVPEIPDGSGRKIQLFLKN